MWQMLNVAHLASVLVRSSTFLNSKRLDTKHHLSQTPLWLRYPSDLGFCPASAGGWTLSPGGDSACRGLCSLESALAVALVLRGSCSKLQASD